MNGRWYWTLAAGLVLVLSAIVAFFPRLSPAGPDKRAAKEGPAFQAAKLPIGQIVLFSSGVGYFQREGTVEGNARVDLSFPVQDINDLLKSMVVRDLDGGHVSTVSYDSNAPLERTLKSFAVNLTANPSFAQILDQARGEKVEVVARNPNSKNPEILTGTLIGTEKQKQAVGGKDTIEVELLNLWSADGMRSVKLTDVQRVHFLNSTLDSEFKKALSTLASAHDTQKKSVAINFLGEGKRDVRVSYVVENPIWKTSYRLVLDKDARKPFLQGWAMVENPTDEDWKDVRMALVSGRPISFQMDLYQPLYVPRPVVEMELFASLRPVAYSGEMEKSADKAARMEGAPAEMPAPAKPAAPQAGLGGMMAGKDTRAGASLGRDNSRRLSEELKKRLDLNAGVSSMAQAAKLGDFFQYVIGRPVTLARQKSALLPIINKEVEGTRVSIYNEATQAKFALLGLRLKNNTGLHLMQGPITIFEGSSYAGDARILDLQPNEERLISYAIDLGTEVNPVPSSDNGRITEIRAIKGIAYITTKVRETKTYTVKNRNEQERTVVIEHPVRNDFKLVSTDKPIETASDVYRFQIEVAPGKAAKQVVSEERVTVQGIQLTNLDDDSIRLYIRQAVISDKVKAGLQKALELRGALQKTQREIAELQRQLDAIRTDQPRLRANLKELPQTSDVFQRIVKKLNDQETQIEKYQDEIKKLQGTEHEQRKAFEDFLAAFTAE